MVDFFISAFKIILYDPLFNVLVLLYQYLPGKDFGLAVIVLTILIRIILYPLMTKSLRSQKILSELQPKVKEIREKHKNDKEKQAREMLELYRKEKINPLSGFFTLLIQLPILIALYQLFWRGIHAGTMHHLYSFVSNPGQVDPSFLNLINLNQPSFFLAILAGVSQFFQSKTAIPKASQKQKQTSQFANMFQKQMLYFFPIFTVLILLKLPSALGLYWIISSLFSVFQQHLIFKPKTKNGTTKP